jgi:hypothetical protein
MTMRLLIPLSIRQRNGRPMIVPPAEMAPDTGAVNPHIMKAIVKAWSCRRTAGIWRIQHHVRRWPKPKTSRRWQT